MRIELRVPAGGESVTEVQVADWLKRVGDRVQRDEPVVILETEKAAMELPSPVSGVLAEIVKQTGDTAQVGDVLAYLDEAPAPAAPAPEPRVETPPAQESAAAQNTPIASHPPPLEEAVPGDRDITPSLQAPSAPAVPRAGAVSRAEDVQPMSLLRRRVAERLVQAQQNAALLTTFNEIDMTAVVALRHTHRELFQERHGVKLGFMAFFVKASVAALEQFPGLNAEIRGTDIVYRNYVDIGIAVGGGRGLVVPVLRNAAQSSFAEIEAAIEDFANRAHANRLTPEELQGGTFTISNGGVYGSLLSTPIVNPPQSGVLGLHAIQDRPVARDGQVVIRPMMYVALTYDHRIVDGREAVSFLRRVKDYVEEPARLLLEI